MFVGLRSFYYYISLVLLLFYNSLFAQKENLSGFTSLACNYKFSTKFYLNPEFQFRANDRFYKPDYYEIKTGLGYNLNSSNQIYLGLGRYATYTNERISREEFRIWLQHVYSLYISKLKFEQRIRLEKRFFHNPITNDNTNSERFRYRLNLTVPLNNEKIAEKTFFINTYDEIFLVTEKPIINRNRIFIGSGYQFTKSFGLSIGYLLQRDFSNNSNINLHFLYTGFSFTIDKSKSEDNIQTPSPDNG